jgi:hypothetical protein
LAGRAVVIDRSPTEQRRDELRIRRKQRPADAVAMSKETAGDGDLVSCTGMSSRQRVRAISTRVSDVAGVRTLGEPSNQGRAGIMLIPRWCARLLLPPGTPWTRVRAACYQLE